MNRNCILLAYFILLIQNVAGFPRFMTSTECDREISPGVTIMAGPAVADSSLTVEVSSSSGQSLSSGGTYVPGEVLTVTLNSPSGVQYVLEATSSVFSGASGCGGTRIDNSAGVVVAPPAGTGPITFKAGWAPGFGIVSISDTFVLAESGVDSTPLPSQDPSGIPSASVAPTRRPRPTAEPQVQPTEPTAAPTRRPRPTAEPQVQPTEPTAAPTRRPRPNSTSSRRLRSISPI